MDKASELLGTHDFSPRRRSVYLLLSLSRLWFYLLFSIVNFVFYPYGRESYGRSLVTHSDMNAFSLPACCAYRLQAFLGRSLDHLFLHVSLFARFSFVDLAAFHSKIGPSCKSQFLCARVFSFPIANNLWCARFSEAGQIPQKLVWYHNYFAVYFLTISTYDWSSILLILFLYRETLLCGPRGFLPRDFPLWTSWFPFTRFFFVDLAAHLSKIVSLRVSFVCARLSNEWTNMLVSREFHGCLFIIIIT